MSLKYGLNIKRAGPAPARKTLLDDEDEEDDFDPNSRGPAAGEEEIQSITTIRQSGTAVKNAPPSRSLKPNTLPGKPPSRRNREEDDRQDLSSVQAAQKQVQAAEELDPSIFDYDSFLDAKSTVNEAKKAAAKQDAIDRKPKYINNLMDAAARRKQDQTIAKEKLLQKEREAEGDEFADKEKFVTGAYKQQQEENRRLEAEEKERAEAEEQRRRQMGGGMQGFYRVMMDQREKQHQEAMEATSKIEREGGARAAGEAKEKSDFQLAAELRAKGVNVHVNDDGQITDKRELLSAGLNVAPSGKGRDERGSGNSGPSIRPMHPAFSARNDPAKQGQRERQTRMMEEQLAAQAKRAREEEEEERQRMEKAAKSTKTNEDVSDARARYLARKAARDKGES